MYNHAITPHRSFALKPLAAAVLVVCASGLHAAPTFNGSPGNNVTVETNGSTTTVTQSVTPNNRALANWNDFSIADNEAVVFEQPNANSVILNRVLGNNPSEILGRLNANGRVFLINPNGIVFGANSEVNVGGLVASTLTLKPGSQNNSDLIEFELTDSDGTITSNGTIKAKDIALISTQIQNNGMLNASGTGATVQLIAASEVTANTSGTDLVLNVAAGHDNAVINQLGEVLSQGGKIVLLARSQTVGPASVINTANIARASQIDIQGDVVRLTGDINVSDTASNLQVTAREIEQAGRLRVGGTTQLSADTVTLTNASNSFQETLNVNVADQVSVRAGQDLVVSGTAGTATLQAENIVLNGLQTTGDVVLSASGSITQGDGNSNALAIGGTTQIDNAASVRLDNSLNDFEEAVSLNGTGAVALVDQNDLRVQGQTNTLDLVANRIVQDSQLQVSSTASLQANMIELNDTANDFQGQVNVLANGQLLLTDANNLSVAGSAGNAAFVASGVTFSGPMAVSEDLDIVAENVGQLDTLMVVGATRLDVTGEVDLSNLGNDFGSVVILSNQADVVLADQNGLTVQGTAGDLTLRAINGSAGEVTLGRINAESLNVSANRIGQSGALSVVGSTTLAGGEINLANSGNNFDALVSVNSAGSTTIHSDGDLELRGSAQSLTVEVANTLCVSSIDAQNIQLTANQIDLQNLAASGDLTLNGGTVNQQGALTVEGITRLSASAVNLQNAANDFKGVVDLNSAGEVLLRDANALRLQGQASSINAQATGLIDQSEALNIAGASEFVATTVSLDSTGNTFGGVVAVNATQTANLRAQGNLAVSGQARNLTATSGETLRLDATQAETLLASGGQVIQAGALRVASGTTVNGGSVNLNNSENDFSGALDLNVSGNATVRDANNLLLTGRAGTADVQAANTLTLGGVQVESGSFIADTIHLNALNVQNAARLQASVITQTQAAETAGTLTLAANEVSLVDAGNDFQGRLVLEGVDTANIQDANQLEVGGQGNVLNATVGGVLTLNGATWGALNVQATEINQTGTNQAGALTVLGQSNLVANSVSLQNAGNDFIGQVNLQVAGPVRLNDTNNLAVQGSVGNAILSADNSVTLNGLQAQQLRVNANQLEQSGALTVENELTLNAATSNLSQADNQFQGEVVLLRGNNTLHTQGDLSVQGAALQLNVVADNVTQSSEITVTGASNLVANSIELSNTENDFQGSVELTVTGSTHIRDRNNLTLSGDVQDLNATSGGTLTLQELNAASLLANADQIQLNQLVVTTNSGLNATNNIGQTGEVLLGGPSSLTARTVQLDNSENDFSGALDLDVSGNATVRDANDLLLTGQAGAADIQVDNTLTLGDVQIESGNFSADTIQLNSLNVQDSARLQASVITQTQAAETAGALTLAANEVSLVDAGNDFQGRLVLEGVDTANIQDANQLQVSGQANVLNVTAGEELTFAGTSTVGTLNANATAINQTGVLSVLAQSGLVADSVSLQHADNDFIGQVDLQVAGPIQLNDTNNLAVQGSVGNAILSADNSVTLNGLQAQQLRINANQLAQTQALAVENELTLNAATSNLSHADNQFQGEVVLLRGNNTLHTAGNLNVQGAASQLNVVADNVTQSSEITVTGASNLTANSIELSNTENDFQGAVELTATGSTHIRDRNNLTLSGDVQDLNATSGGTLTLQELNAASLLANADQIQLNQLVVTNNSSLNATNNIAQTGEVSLGGPSSLTARTVQLDNSENDFGGALTLNVSGNATVRDANNLLLTGQAGSADIQAATTLTLGGVQVESGNFSADTIELNRLNAQDFARLQASVITQTQAVETSGRLSLVANTVSLTDTGNDFSGELRVNSATANIVDSNDLTMTFAGGNLTAQAANLNVNELRATGDVAITADTANLVSTGDLSLQGQVGTLNVQARSLSQSDALLVQGTARLNADNVELRHQANDFQGEVVLNVSGNAALNDLNTLDVSGRVQGTATFSAQSVMQSNALITESDLVLRASQVNLSNEANSLGGALSNQLSNPSSDVPGHAVQLEGVAQAVLTSQGNLKIQGAVDSLTLAAQTVELGPLGSLQNLNVVANDVRQSAALRVEGQSNFTANNIELRNVSNDFVGLVTIQARDATVSRVALADSNTLAVQGHNMQLAAQVQGDLNLQADNVVLNSTVVQGSSTLNVEGELTQNQSVELNNTTLTADKITLSHSENRFDGLTQVRSNKLIELGSASDLDLDALDSTGALALNVQGDAAVSGGNVTFSNSVFNKNLNVTANDVSQTGRLMVQGDAEFNAPGGVVDLQNANNSFVQTVSVNAERTSVSAQGDLRIRDLMTRGGAISAQGRLMLQGRIEQTGGTLSFTAEGIPRPLSSAEIALMLPPQLDVFSAKEAVDPLTGLGRITLASAVIQQESGQIVTSADSRTQFKSTQNGSVVLVPVDQSSTNQINGQLEALAGQDYGQEFVYQQERGASLFAVNNDVQLHVAGNGVESDVVAIRSRGLATVGDDSMIRARLPYNNTAAGTSRSYAGLTLSIPLGAPQQGSTSVASFGESSGIGRQAAALGAIRVEVGELDRAGLGGFVTVLPFEGSNLLPGQVVYLAGPERRGTYAFFYDGARNLNRIPVVYNGSLLLSPQENAALTTAQGAVVLARQEQTRSVVRTENVAGKIINGVVAEVGPGRPATEGEGGAGKPDSCDAAGDGLSCNP